MIQALTDKTCFKCSRTLPIDEFYKHPMMADKHLGKCKDCARADVMQNRRLKESYYREYDLSRATHPHRKKMRNQYRAKQREEQPQKHRAGSKAWYALRQGLLTKRPCYFCGSEDHVEMHHPDYEQPLMVYWLCRICHRKLDNMNKSAERRKNSRQEQTQ